MSGFLLWITILSINNGSSSQQAAFFPATLGKDVAVVACEAAGTKIINAIKAGARYPNAVDIIASCVEIK